MVGSWAEDTPVQEKAMLSQEVVEGGLGGGGPFHPHPQNGGLETQDFPERSSKP